MKYLKITILASIGIATILFSNAYAQNSIASPLEQLKSGIIIQDIKCKEGFALVIRESNEHPACIKLDHIARLLTNGWVTLEKFETTHPTVVQHNESVTQKNETSSSISKNTASVPLIQKQIDIGNAATNATDNITKNYSPSTSSVSNKNKDVVDDICSAGTNHNSTYVTDSFKISKTFTDGNIPSLNGTVYQPTIIPLPEVTRTFTIVSSTMPDVIKILCIGMSPNPLKVGDKPQFTITYQNISNKPITHDLDFDCCWWFGYSITPPDNVQESTYGENPQKLGWGGEKDLQPNQIVTDPGRGAVSINPSANTGGEGPVHADYTITKPGILTVTANMWLAVGSADLYETIQFNVNATQ